MTHWFPEYFLTSHNDDAMDYFHLLKLFSKLALSYASPPIGPGDPVKGLRIDYAVKRTESNRQCICSYKHTLNRELTMNRAKFWKQSHVLTLTS